MQSQEHLSTHADEFVFTPTKQLTCYFETRTDFHNAMRAFANASFAVNDIHVLYGEEGIEILDVDGHRHGTLARLSRLLQSVMADTEIHEFERMEEHLRQGHIVIAVPAPHADEKSRAHQIMHDNNGHHITYFARFYIETVEE